MQKLWLTIIALCWFGGCYAETSVWKVQKDGASIFVGGTIHLLRPSDYPLPEAFDKAFYASQVIIFETDIAQLNTPTIAQQMLVSLNYSDHRSLASEVSAQTLVQLQQLADSFGFPLELMKKAKPGLLMSTLTLLELNKLGVNQQGIDQFYFQKANQLGKKLRFLETPMQQVNFLASLGIGYEDVFYQNMLAEFRNTEGLFFEVIEQWRKGNSEQLNLLVNLPMKKQSPQTYQTLLVERNNNWMPKIEGYFNSSEIEFVLVGAAHLIGEDGIIFRLKAKGYQVTPL